MPALRFVRGARNLEGMDVSYRKDNLLAPAPLMDCSTFCPVLAEVRKDGHWNSLALASID